jgi:hypothetical protein
MARELFGTEVLDGTTVKWGTIGSIVFGTPIYLIARGWSRGIAFVFGGIGDSIADLFGWYRLVMSVGLIQATRGWRRSTIEFATSIDQFGIFAALVATAVSGISLTILLWGVTNVIEWFR